jgi:hypothetical protein
MLFKPLEKDGLLLLEHRCREGRSSAGEIREPASAATAELRLQTYLNDVRVQLKAE